VNGARDDAWVTPLERLTAEDERILHLESETVAGHTCKVIILERGPGPDATAAVRRRIEERIDRVPRCRQRVAPAPARANHLCWCDDDTFSVERHVRPVPAPEGGMARADLLALVGELMAGRLDRARPLWSIHVVEALEDGRCALIWRIHHCMADGMTAMRWASELLWDDDVTPSHAEAAAGAAPTRDSRLDHVRHVIETAQRAPRALARELRPVSGPSPFAAAVGTHRVVACARSSLDEMREVGQSAGGATINDVLLAVVAGGIRSWLLSREIPLHAIRLKVPVSMHTAPGTDAGNRDSFLFVDVPLASADPAARLRAVHQATAARKQHHDAQTLYSVFDTLGRVAPLGHAATRIAMSPHVFAVSVSNVPGPRVARAVDSSRVEELYSLAEVAPHHALRVSAASHAGTLFVGLNADPGAVPDLGVLAAGIETSMTELASIFR
jgi:WS/DGAT/MGAT family acyltransferase